MSMAVVKKPSIYKQGMMRIFTSAFPHLTIIDVDPMDFSHMQLSDIDMCLIDIDDVPHLIDGVKKQLGDDQHLIIWTENENHPDLRHISPNIC